MTSYSVRNSTISFSVEPLRESGGTSVEFPRTSARSFLTARPACSWTRELPTGCSACSQRDSRQLPFFVRLGQARDHPQQLGPQFAPRTAQIQVERVAPFDHEAQHLMHQVFAERAGAHDPLAQGIAQFT